jgi:hypothetical protein
MYMVVMTTAQVVPPMKLWSDLTMLESDLGKDVRISKVAPNMESNQDSHINSNAIT